MAGRNQHHIPQSVLKGFARDPNEEPKRVWHYLRGAPIAAKTTAEVAAQRDFYSKPGAAGEVTLDDKITDYERDQFMPLLTRLRAASVGDPVKNEDAAEYLGHLIPRGDYMRRVFGETLTRFLGDAKSFIADPQKVHEHLGFDDLEPGGQVLESLQKAFQENGISPLLAQAKIPERPVERLAFAVFREYAAPAMAAASARIAEHFAEMAFDVKTRVKQAHTDALEKIGPDHRMPRLEGYTFTIEATEAELVLPDCVAVAIDQDGAISPFTMLKREQTVVIIAPLSPHRALVGRTDPAAALRDDTDLAGKIAACSHMFFVAATDNFREVYSKLGEISEAEVTRVVEGVFTRPRKLLPEEVKQEAQTRPFTLRTPSGFKDEETAELGQFIADMAGDIHAKTPLDCLEGVTVVEHGDLDDIGRYFVEFAAMDIDVQEGRLRLWPYLPRAVGEALVRESAEEDFRLALLTLVFQLTRVAAACRLNSLSPDYLKQRSTDSSVALHHQGVVGALPIYLAAASQRSLDDEPRLDALLEDAAINALATADERIEAARSVYVSTMDGDGFTLVAAQCVGLITHASAAIAGRTEAALDKFPKFAEALRSRGLDAWFRRYALDLAAFWGEPRSVAEPRSWGLHSERLMVRWGIVTWPVGDQGQSEVRVFPKEFVDGADKFVKAMAANINTLI